MEEARIPKSGDTLILPSGRVTIHLVAEGVLDISSDKNVTPILLSDVVPSPNGEPATWVLADRVCECGHLNTEHMNGNGKCGGMVELFEQRTPDGKQWSHAMDNRAMTPPHSPCECKRFARKG